MLNAERNKAQNEADVLLDNAALQEAVHSLKHPPRLKNDASNNCWFHACLEILWVMGDAFHKMIQAKKEQKKLLAEEYENELKRFEEKKKKYDNDMVGYRKENKKAEEYENALRKYRNDLHEYDKIEKKKLEPYKAQIKEFEKAAEKYKKDLEAWEKSDKAQPKPEEPKAPEKPPEGEKPKAPVEVKAPRKPDKPLKPADPLLFLEALEVFSNALKGGKQKDISDAAHSLQKAVVSYHREFNEYGIQQDAPAFLDLVFSFLAPAEYVLDDQGQRILNKEKKPITKQKPLFKMETVRKGEEEFDGFKHVGAPDDQNILKLYFKDHKAAQATFQDILKYNFKKRPPEIGQDAISMVNEQGERKPVNLYSEKQRIANKQNPPDFLVVQMVRYYEPDGEQLAQERLEVIKRQKELLKEKTDELIKKEPEAYKDVERKEIEKEVEKILRKKGNWPAVPQQRNRKNTSDVITSIEPINFAKAFGVNDPKNTDYQYLLYGAVVQGGGIGGGHYTANVRGINPKGGEPQWCHTDDMGAQVKPLQQDKVVDANKEGYVYFFKRVKKPAVQAN